MSHELPSVNATCLHQQAIIEIASSLLEVSQHSSHRRPSERVVPPGATLQHRPRETGCLPTNGREVRRVPEPLEVRVRPPMKSSPLYSAIRSQVLAQHKRVHNYFHTCRQHRLQGLTVLNHILPSSIRRSGVQMKPDVCVDKYDLASSERVLRYVVSSIPRPRHPPTPPPMPDRSPPRSRSRASHYGPRGLALLYHPDPCRLREEAL